MCCPAVLVLLVSILNIPAALVSKEKVHKEKDTMGGLTVEQFLWKT